MASWHKRARTGIAVFGLSVAAIVYLAMGERQSAAPPSPVPRLDPNAVLEITSGILEGMTGVEKNFQLQSSTSQRYADGSERHSSVMILVHKGDDRTFRVSAEEGLLDPEQTEIRLSGNVRLEDSDGFYLAGEAVTYDRGRSIAHTEAHVTFGRGRMSGSGAGITYDQANNVLTVASQAQVTTRNEAGDPVMQFSSGRATLDRTQHLLTVQDTVRVDRDGQIIEADRAIAALSENDDVIRFLELRGNSRVAGGGGGIDAMSANDIDLDYTDDGQRLEAVRLDGTAAVARTGANGASEQLVAESIRLALSEDGSSHMILEQNASVATTASEGRNGRRMAAQSLELDVAGDGALTRAIGRTDVRLDLPAVEGAPARSIRAATLDGTGKAGAGLTNATFTGGVVFTEADAAPAQAEKRAGSEATSALRTARAETLEATLAEDAVTGATFTGEATFEEAGLKACAARMDYQPGKGALALSGSTAAGRPIVAEEETTIEAATIDVVLETRRMTAKGGVTSEVGAATRCRPATPRAASRRGPNRMPGLLKAGAAVTIRGAALDYDGEAGRAVYSGRASITQSDTSVNADTIALDQKNGDLTATGNAIATMVLDGGTTTGRAHEIQYLDARRLMRYLAPPVGTIVPPVPAGRPAPARQPQLSGPQGELQAVNRIDVLLDRDGGRVERIDAYGNVRLRYQPESETGVQGARVASGGAQLTYLAAEEKYVMTAGPAAPVVLVSDCREMTGKTLTFYKSNATIEIDGVQERRTQNSKASGPCTPAPPPR